MIRKKIKQIAESITTHEEVVLAYNKIKPLPVGYKISMSDDWCASFVSVVFWYCKYIDFAECSVPRMIELAKKKGIYKNKNYNPQVGDVVIYDWDSIKDGDHVGIIIKKEDNLLTVREGNKSNAIGNRLVNKSAECISGYIAPKFEEETTLTYKLVDDIVDAIIRGDFGNGEERKESLYQYFQILVNNKMKK